MGHVCANVLREQPSLVKGEMQIQILLDFFYGNLDIAD